MSASVDSNKRPSGPLVSIVTPSYNQAQFIEKTIRSVVFQDYPSLEYFVLDALSNDGTEAILNKYSSRIAKVVRARDDGQADAIDKGFQLSSGEIMAYINSDDCYATPYVVSRAVALFAEHPDVDVIYGKREYIDEQGFFLQNYPFRDFEEDKLVEACFIPQECVFWRKSIYEKAGNKVDKEFKFAMDYDLWLRFISAGAKFLSVDEYFGLFRWYPGQKSRDVWIKHGIPEIARLQQEHLGRALPEDEMIAKYQEHWYGVNRLDHARTFTQSVRVWNLFASNKKAMLSDIPRDQWVFQNHLEAGLNLPEVVPRWTKTSQKLKRRIDSDTVTAEQSSDADFAKLKELVRRTKLFDAAFYNAQLPEPVEDPLAHFYSIGAVNGLSPHPLFNTRFYSEQNPDIVLAGQNGLLHWLLLGASEGRNPHPLFDTKFYLKENPWLRDSDINPLQHFMAAAESQVRSPHLLFDTEHYLRRYGADLNGTNPLLHYLKKGKLLCDPHPLFDSEFYIRQCADEMSESELTPLEHFIAHGAISKISPHPKLRYEVYELSQPGIRTSGMNVLEHFLLEGRNSPDFGSTTA